MHRRDEWYHIVGQEKEVKGKKVLFCSVYVLSEIDGAKLWASKFGTLTRVLEDVGFVKGWSKAYKVCMAIEDGRIAENSKELKPKPLVCKTLFD